MSKVLMSQVRNITQRWRSLNCDMIFLLAITHESDHQLRHGLSSSVSHMNPIINAGESVLWMLTILGLLQEAHTCRLRTSVADMKPDLGCPLSGIPTIGPRDPFGPGVREENQSSAEPHPCKSSAYQNCFSCILTLRKDLCASFSFWSLAGLSNGRRDFFSCARRCWLCVHLCPVQTSFINHVSLLS